MEQAVGAEVYWYSKISEVAQFVVGSFGLYQDIWGYFRL